MDAAAPPQLFRLRQARCQLGPAQPPRFPKQIPPPPPQPTMSTAAEDDADYDRRADGSVMPDVLAKGREACYKARDAFYACVEECADKKPTEIATMGLLYPADCKKSRANFVSSCLPTWVKHFDREYCAKKRVQRLLDGDEDRRGPISLPQPYTFKQ
ncbi:uncharacterized protein LOC133898694 [Phragmites australis]|uniref:uncharacterized protein LOC133898694 n=1 Tax=Phragmites australis TaxID=29695 RepID=UPI002D798BA0|nr:uncharacterized protein LOC133898694 [Phragmites australis]XP_062195351.1 uncharacterized protein LOC133898694 [Phragmites australis]